VVKNKMKRSSIFWDIMRYTRSPFTGSRCSEENFASIIRVEDKVIRKSDAALLATYFMVWKEPQPKVCTRSTNWQVLKETINKNIRLNHRMKETQQFEEVVHYLTKLIQEAAWKATPPPKKDSTKKSKHTTTHSRCGSGKKENMQKMATNKKPARQEISQ
jgi:hypothetical protein